MHHEEESRKEKQESKARKAIEKHKSSHYLLLFLALLGACMMISDTVLTPAISGSPVYLFLFELIDLCSYYNKPYLTRLCNYLCCFIPSVLSAAKGLGRSLGMITKKCEFACIWTPKKKKEIVIFYLY